MPFQILFQREHVQVMLLELKNHQTAILHSKYSSHGWCAFVMIPAQASKTGGGALAPLDFEIRYFPINSSVEKCFPHSLELVK